MTVTLEINNDFYRNKLSEMAEVLNTSPEQLVSRIVTTAVQLYAERVNRAKAEILDEICWEVQQG